MSKPSAANEILCPTPETLAKLLRDEIDATEGGSVEEHVGVCPDCQRVLDRLVGDLPDALTPLPQSPELPADRASPTLPGYTTLGRIDAGGMGVVWHVRDLQFGRDLALKVMASRGRTVPRRMKRFLTEARVCAQLTHPFIVPVHAMGRMPDGRPYYTMKLVQGQTLAALLEGGPAPAERRMEVVQIFDKVCQAMAFAHGRGVIHRDLKPENVMVGAHGEVQLMDWGLAKVLADADPICRPEGETFGTENEPEETEGNRTRVGSVLGTAAYMAPEQARGRLEEVDRQSDVFGLGGILCRILTGEAPYADVNAEAARRRAAEADLGPALARLRGCGADPELIELAERCLAPRKADRLADAGAVAAQLAAYQTGVQERLRQAELERAAARAAAAVERTARRRTRALAAAVLALVVLSASGGLWMQHQAAERRAELARQEGALRQQVTADLDQAIRFRQAGHFEASRGLLEQAQQRLADEGPDDLLRQVEQCLSDTELARRLDDAREQASIWVEGKFDFADAIRNYAQAIAEAGLERESEDPAEVGARVRACAVRAEVVAALDDWAGMTRDEAQRAWLLSVARAADPDPERDRVRQPKLWRDREALRRLALKSAEEPLPPQLATALSRALDSKSGDAVPLLRTAQARHPDDFWVNLALAEALSRSAQWNESTGYYRAALALRPRSAAVHNNLGNALYGSGQVDAAIGYYEQALRLDPRVAQAHYNLGIALADKGQREDALRCHREALKIDPQFAPAHVGLGMVLAQQNRIEDAIGHYEQALKLDPSYALTHYNLAIVLAQRGQIKEAIWHYEQSLELDPKNVKAHTNLGGVLVDQGQLEPAIGHLRKALQLQPNFAPAHLNLAIALRTRNELDAAIRHCEQALQSDPKMASAHVELGVALESKGEVDKAIRHYEQAIQIDPAYSTPHANLATSLYLQAKAAEAIDHFKKALRLDPGNALIHCRLGIVLGREGCFAEALDSLKRGHELGSKRANWRYPSAQWVRDVEHLLLLDRKLPAILSGQEKPADPAEQLDFAKICAFKKQYAAAVRFAADAFTAQPALAENLQAGHRYDAACAAALAGCGRSADAAHLSETEKARLRRQAREWLGADLTLRAKQLPRDRSTAERALRHWLKNSDLSGVRDPASLAKLAEEERREWQSLWQQVERLLDKPRK